MLKKFKESFKSRKHSDDNKDAAHALPSYAFPSEHHGTYTATGASGPSTSAGPQKLMHSRSHGRMTLDASSSFASPQSPAHTSQHHGHRHPPTDSPSHDPACPRPVTDTEDSEIWARHDAFLRSSAPTVTRRVLVQKASGSTLPPRVSSPLLASRPSQTPPTQPGQLSADATAAVSALWPGCSASDILSSSSSGLEGEDRSSAAFRSCSGGFFGATGAGGAGVELGAPRSSASALSLSVRGATDAGRLTVPSLGMRRSLAVPEVQNSPQAPRHVKSVW